MGRGTRHELVGVLLDDESFLILRVPDGGQWRLDLSGRYRHLVVQG
ncbi:DUF5818 domain-containing protein [Sphingobium sp. BHU LFT2]|nr:DUF5818 domain-containing protein [Sphingobium sp. BHU LFT2]